MTYNLDFHPDALKEWGKLGETVKGQFKNCVTTHPLHGH